MAAPQSRRGSGAGDGAEAAVCDALADRSALSMPLVRDRIRMLRKCVRNAVENPFERTAIITMSRTVIDIDYSRAIDGRNTLPAVLPDR
ncbi:hypothetical protein [Lysobacter sp. yr284]|uniref:hypothetical protein n=1 Tax=Lysobacter sp. yr284 TaxID=1761791 RepID=UPI001113AE4F|nr:hypothetical protein [Lysobacter sp. yr284]